MTIPTNWLPALLVLGSLVSACGGPDDREELPVTWDAPDFALVDQTGDTLRAGEFEGTAWVAHFFFINCEGVCPTTTARMKELRDSLATDGLLGGSPPSEWAFLTGTSPEAIRRLFQEGFKVAASGRSATDTATNYQLNHSPRLALVDPEGRVRATYDATDPGAIDSLRSNLDTLLP